VPLGLFISTCSIDIRWFPFDDQLCHLKFGSWTYDGNKINLTAKDDRIDISTYKISGEWDLLGSFSFQCGDTTEGGVDHGLLFFMRHDMDPGAKQGGHGVLPPMAAWYSTNNNIVLSGEDTLSAKNSGKPLGSRGPASNPVEVLGVGDPE